MLLMSAHCDRPRLLYNHSHIASTASLLPPVQNQPDHQLKAAFLETINWKGGVIPGTLLLLIAVGLRKCCSSTKKPKTN
jgi:hypothetical protein